MLLNYVFFHKPVGCRGFVSGTCPFGQVAANHQFASPCNVVALVPRLLRQFRSRITIGVAPDAFFGAMFQPAMPRPL